MAASRRFAPRPPSPSRPRAATYLALSGDRSDGDRQHAERLSLRLNGNVGLRLSDEIETRFYATINHINQDLPGALARAQAVSTPWLSRPNTILGDHERNIDSLRVQNRTSVALGAATMTGGAFLNIKQLFHPIFQVIDQKSTDHGLFARLDLAGARAGVPAELTLGATARFGTIRARNFLNVDGRRGAIVSDAEQTARTLNAYGEVRMTPVAQLSVVAGGMLIDGRREVANRTSAARSGKAGYTAFSPRFGLLYAPTQRTQLFANVSRSVELPGLTELSQTPFSVGATLPPGFVDIGAQRAWTIEVGARGRSGVATFDVAVYRAAIRGELLQFDRGAGVPAATFNANRTRHQGIEAGLGLALAAWVRLRQVYTFSDFRFRDDPRYRDNRLPVVPRHAYRGELRVGTERHHITPNIEWVPQGAFADYRNTARTPGYALLGLTAATALPGGVTVFADARNLTGKKAIGDVSAAVEASPAAAIYYPVERRALYAGLRAVF